MEAVKLSDWLEAIATRPLPGGVAAAAIAGALGAALLAKAAHLTLQRHALRDPDQGRLERTLDRVQRGRRILVHLAEADADAYRAVIKAERSAAAPPVRDAAWQAAIEAPLQVAEICHSLLRTVSHLRAHGGPATSTEVQTAVWLLQAARRACLLAAGTNLDGWGQGPAAEQLRLRMEALSQSQAKGGTA
jgi:formiminotetrahydrofolate cyclodeaminase